MSKRLSYIDIAKAVAVLLVIFGHTFRESMRAEFSWCDFSYNFVYRFHVSLLFILSGMGYALSSRRNKQENTGKFICKKAKKLLLPWFSYSLIIYAVFALIQLIPGMRAFFSGSSYEFISLPRFIVQLLKNENPYCFHVWYLQTLFLYVIFTYFTDKYCSERLSSIIKIVLILSAPLLYSCFFTGTIWTVKGFVQKIMFFLIGTLLRDDAIQKHKKMLMFSGIFCGIILAVMTDLSMIQNLQGVNALGLVMSYVENVMIFGLCMGIIGVCAMLEARLSALARFGKNTMSYYLYHQPFCCAFLGMLLYDKMGFSAWSTVIVCMAAGIIIPYAFTKVTRFFGLDKILNKIGLPS